MHLDGLYAIVDPGLRPDPIPDLCARAARGGARVIQLRWKAGTSRELLEAARAALPLVHAAGAALVINDRPDVALLAGADGVHVGDEDLPVDEVRRLVGPRMRVGATARDLDAIRAAAAAGADHVGFGPVFPTSTKRVPAEPRGLALLAEVCAASPLPVVAIAGIDLSRIAAVARAGAAAAAVASDLLLAEDIEARARELAGAFESGKRGRMSA